MTTKKKTSAEKAENPTQIARKRNLERIDSRIDSAFDGLQSVRVPTRQEIADRNASGYYREEVQKALIEGVFAVAEKFNIEPREVPFPKDMSQEQRDYFDEVVRKKLYKDPISGTLGYASAAIWKSLPKEEKREGVIAEMLTRRDKPTAERLALIAYFVMHPDVQPDGTEPLKEKQQADVVSTYQKFKAYITEHPINEENANETVRAFVESQIPRYRSKPLSELYIQIDKVMNRISQERSEGDQNFRLSVATEKEKRQGKEVEIIVSLVFNESENVHYSKNITFYDRLVYAVISSFWEQGTTVLTCSMIYSAIHAARPEKRGVRKISSARPDKKGLCRIMNSIVKMMTTLISIDTTMEKAKHKNSVLIVKTSTMLQCEITAAFVNGVFTQSAIVIEKIPFLYEFAKERKNFTTVPLDVIRNSVRSDTDGNLGVFFQLIFRIAQMKNNPKLRRVITLDNLYEFCLEPQEPTSADRIAFGTRKDQFMVRAIAADYLTTFRKCGYIDGYAFDSARKSYRIKISYNKKDE